MKFQSSKTLNMCCCLLTMSERYCRKAHELLHEEESKKAGVKLIKRFSGGGTVIVDENTLFATLIMAQPAVPDVECYPRSIMRWSQDFYNPVFLPYGDFSLQEHGVTLLSQNRNGKLIENLQ